MQSNRISANTTRRLKTGGQRLAREIGRLRPKIQKITPQRLRDVSLTLGNVAPILSNRISLTEIGLAGWGARIRTWEWRNQNPLDYPTISTRIWKNRPKRALAISIAWQPFPNENDPPQGGSIPRNLGPRDQGLRCREHQSIYIDPLIRHETNHGVASDTASAKKDAISRSST